MRTTPEKELLSSQGLPLHPPLKKPKTQTSNGSLVLRGSQGVGCDLSSANGAAFFSVVGAGAVAGLSCTGGRWKGQQQPPAHRAVRLCVAWISSGWEKRPPVF